MGWHGRKGEAATGVLFKRYGTNLSLAATGRLTALAEQDPLLKPNSRINCFSVIMMKPFIAQ